MTGKIRVWPKSSNYDNYMYQIAMIHNSKRYIFTGYNNRQFIEHVIILLHNISSNTCQVIDMNIKDPRTVAIHDVKDWCKRNNIKCHEEIGTYLNELKKAITCLNNIFIEM